MNPNMPPVESSSVADRARIVWRMRLSSAVRSAAACAAVGVATLYGPKFLSSHIKFSAFSYLTAVLIVCDATLGDTLRGCWHAICATAQVVPLAMVWRRVVAPEGGMPASAAAVAVAVASFAVALPQRTHITAKKIAFGQIVLICSDVVLDDVSGDGFMHPLYVAASTALGVLASVFALLLPYPGLASHKVEELWRVYAENASQRMNLFLGASTAPNNHSKMDILSLAKPLSITGAKLLDTITTLQDGLKWERPWSRASPAERLQSMELQMRGIEYSLFSSASIPIQPTHQHQLSTILQTLSTPIQERIEQLRCYSPFHSKTRDFTSLPLEPNLPNLNQGCLSLFFSCISMFLNHAEYDFEKIPADTNPDIITRFKDWIQKLTTYKRLEFPFKCSISLSLAMLLGLTFDKENGCWAGLTIAISFVTGRQAIFTVANSRVQGTALGSVYGVICCFIFHYEELRLLALLPWIIFASMLRYSRMYGTTGGVSAAIGALVILGRKNYGPPNEFAIARLTEVFIGLSAFILVEVFLQPVRAATLAKNHVYLTLRALQDSIKVTGRIMQEYPTTTEIPNLKEKHKEMRYLVSELKDHVADAELEPNFWYSPFHASRYQKLVGSLSNILNLLHFITHNFEKLSKLSQTDIGSKFQEQINDEFQLFQEILGSCYICPEQVNTTDTQAVIEEEMEAGKLCNRENQGVLVPEHVWAAQEEENEENKNLRERMFQCLSAMGFCINSMRREMKDIRICIREIDQW